jgi:hypothetical protein
VPRPLRTSSHPQDTSFKLSGSLPLDRRDFTAARMGEAGIVQKDEINVIRPASPSL